MTAFQPIAAAPRVAVLIDGDNLAVDQVRQALEEAGRLGTLAIRRAYGNWEVRKELAVLLQQHAVRAYHQRPLATRKNGSDIALTVDAIDLLHTQRIDAFAILSSDADFTPLMIRLREAGKDVYGFGDKRAPLPLRAAASRFFDLDAATDGSAVDRRGEIEAAVARCAGADGRALLSRIAHELPGDRYGYKKLSKLLLDAQFELCENNKYCKVK